MAISMVSHYSNQHKLMDYRSLDDSPNNILLVTLEGVQHDDDVPIEVLHMVFCALVMSTKLLLLRWKLVFVL